MKLFHKTQPPKPSNPAATADAASLLQAIVILKKALDEIFAADRSLTPRYQFVNHAVSHLRKQMEEHFRYTMRAKE